MIHVDTANNDFSELILFNIIVKTRIDKNRNCKLLHPSVVMFLCRIIACFGRRFIFHDFMFQQSIKYLHQFFKLISIGHPHNRKISTIVYQIIIELVYFNQTSISKNHILVGFNKIID